MDPFAASSSLTKRTPQHTSMRTVSPSRQRTLQTRENSDESTITPRRIRRQACRACQPRCPRASCRTLRDTARVCGSPSVAGKPYNTIAREVPNVSVVGCPKDADVVVLHALQDLCQVTHGEDWRSSSRPARPQEGGRTAWQCPIREGEVKQVGPFDMDAKLQLRAVTDEKIEIA